MAELWSGLTGALHSLWDSVSPSKVEQVIIREVQMNPPGARTFVRLAGISGAIAVSLGAYGSHVFRHKEVDPRLKETFEIANKYHFLHSLALLAVPQTPRPVLTGTLLSSGIILFCGSCYYHAMTGNNTVRKVTPYGGFLLIFAWLSVAL
ncbi:transmembrane protein 256 homolog [Aplysia californica]|uniref:Transmembrane protein 256 homolog n=1 Tax=Aplysia californica TaxID=6500 RepID=A0ABM0JB36_APLCA|nr:transmembrane protein 256 homolog [Aplysia californica]